MKNPIPQEEIRSVTDAARHAAEAEVQEFLCREGAAHGVAVQLALDSATAPLREDNERLRGDCEAWNRLACERLAEVERLTSERNEWKRSTLLYHSELRDLADGKKVETQLGFPVEKLIATLRTRLDAMTRALKGGDEDPQLFNIGWLKTLLDELDNNHEAFALLAGDDPQALTECISNCRNLVRIGYSCLSGKWTCTCDVAPQSTCPVHAKPKHSPLTGKAREHQAQLWELQGACDSLRKERDTALRELGEAKARLAELDPPPKTP